MSSGAKGWAAAAAADAEEEEEEEEVWEGEEEVQNRAWQPLTSDADFRDGWEMVMLWPARLEMGREREA